MIVIIVHIHTYQKDIISGVIVAIIPEEETLSANTEETIKRMTIEIHKELLLRTQGTIILQNKVTIAIILGIVILTIIPITVNTMQGRDNRNIIIKMIPASQETLQYQILLAVRELHFDPIQLPPIQQGEVNNPIARQDNVMPSMRLRNIQQVLSRMKQLI